MNEQYRKYGLKILTLLTILLYLYPIFIVLKYIIFSQLASLLDISIILFSMYFGLGITSFLCRKECYFTTRLLSYISIGIPIILELVINNNNNTGIMIIDLICIITFFIIGLRSFLKDYQNLLNSKYLIVRGSILTGTLLLANIIKDLEATKNIIYVFILIFILASMLLKSIENIDEVFVRRGVEIPEVQKKIRQANYKRIIFLYILILILFNIKDLVTFIVRILFMLYVKVTIFILYFISALLAPKSGNATTNGDSTPNLPFEPGKGNKLFDYFLFVLFTLLIIYLSYKVLPKLMKALISLIQYIKEKLTKVIKVKDIKNEDAECIEIVEITKQTVINKGRKNKVNLSKLLKMAKSQSEKIRIMYAIILKELNKKGVETKCSDTTGDIIKKAHEINGLEENLISTTRIYENVRYGEQNLEQETFDKMKLGFEKIINFLKK